MKRLVFLCFSVFIFCVLTSFVHPYHVGSMEFKYNTQSKTFEISGKFFIDDMENALNKKYGTQLHFGSAQQKNDMNLYLKKYAAEYLKLKVNNQLVKVHYIGFEEDSESVDVYLESEVVSNPKKIETAMSFIYNLFDDQINIIHIVVNGTRKTSKLDYPNRYLYQNF